MTLRSAHEYRSSPRQISVYNTLAGRKEQLDPIDPSPNAPEVKMYVCGLTPQDQSHLGHGLNSARFDMVRRYLAYRRLSVNFVQNVTDIDDKIIDKVLKTGQDPLAMTRGYTDEFYALVDRMHGLPVEKLTRVTEFVPQIISFIQSLIDKGFAYVTPEGNVYFEVSKKGDYGKLSNQNTSMLYESVRKELDKEKRSPLDFALWKRDESTSLSQPSPWGVGRPGWHIECSAMIHETLGDRIDIHGGGLDLKFPHHENEIAQSEAYSGNGFANVWMHGGLLNIEGQKMSKSLNNFTTLVDGLQKYGPAPFRFVVARHHYRSGIDLSDKLFRDNLNALLDFHRLFARVPGLDAATADTSSPEAKALIESFEAAMDNDFNSPEALVALEKARTAIAQQLDSGKATSEQVAGMTKLVVELGKILGLFFDSLEAVETQGLGLVASILGVPPLSREGIAELLRERAEVRAAKNFARSDEIRKEAALRGVEILDSKSGSTFRFV